MAPMTGLTSPPPWAAGTGWDATLIADALTDLEPEGGSGFFCICTVA